MGCSVNALDATNERIIVRSGASSNERVATIQSLIAKRSRNGRNEPRTIALEVVETLHSRCLGKRTRRIQSKSKRVSRILVDGKRIARNVRYAARILAWNSIGDASRNSLRNARNDRWYLGRNVPSPDADGSDASNDEYRWIILTNSNSSWASYSIAPKIPELWNY